MNFVSRFLLLRDKFETECSFGKGSFSRPRLAKKESRLKFYRMSFALHSIDICIFFMLQTEPGRSRLYLRAIYAHPIKIQLSLFVEQLKKMSGFYLNKSVKQCLFTFFKSDTVFKTIGFNFIGRFKKVVGKVTSSKLIIFSNNH